MNKIKNLIVGKSYSLQYTSQFCHTVGGDGFKSFSKRVNSEDILEGCIFVGVINVESPEGERQVFYRPGYNKRSYVMFGNDNYEHILKEE